MPNKHTHYYTIKNKLSGELTLVHAKNRAQGERGFFERRFGTELTTQQDLVAYIGAGVAVVDLTKPPPQVDTVARAAAQQSGAPPTTSTEPERSPPTLGPSSELHLGSITPQGNAP